MPLYDYRCRQCDHLFEVLLRPGADAPPSCPACASDDVQRALSAFAVSSAELTKTRLGRAKKQKIKDSVDKVVAEREALEHHRHDHDHE